MRGKSLASVIGLVLASASWAHRLPDPAQPGHSAAPAAAALPQATQRLRRQQAQVRRLQQDVASRESASRQAGERLRRQDQFIAELQKQLRAAAAHSPGGHP